jgi:hypothetical protein
MTAPAIITTINESTNNMPINAGVPRDIKLSKWYRRRWENEGFMETP